MSRIDKDIIDKVLDAAKIEEVVKECLGEYGQHNKAGLKKCGVRYEALCPFHKDRSLGSFIVYPKKNCYKCFSCGAKGGVIDFLMKHENLSYPDAIRWLGKKYHIDVDGVDPNWTYTPRPAPPPLDMLMLPYWMVERPEKAIDDDLLVAWMRRGVNWDTAQRTRLERVLKDYHVGHGKNGHTIFWQIDEFGRVRTGKMMKYKPDGHRDKESSWNFDFIHSVLSRTFHDNDPWPYPHIFNPDKQEARLTFFGMHLLNHFPNAAIKLVESEKTALLMATAYGNHTMDLWMACGGLEMITRERLQPLIDQNRRIILYPDRDGIDKWMAKAEQMHYSRITVDTEPVTKWWKPEDGEKADIADVVVRILNQSERLTNVGDVAEKMPQVKPLLDNLNLEVEDE
jgi:hypothetical protein